MSEPRQDPTSDGEAPDARRLAARVRNGTDAYRQRVTADTSTVKDMLDSRRASEAARTVEDQRAALEVYEQVVRAAIAETVCERDAERIVAEAAADLETPATADPPASGPSGPDSDRGHRLAAALAGSSLAVLLGIGVGYVSIGPAPGPASQEEVAVDDAAALHLAAADRRLTALRETPRSTEAVATELRHLHDHVLAIPGRALGDPRVRERVHELLDEERAVLRDLTDAHPGFANLIRESHAVRATLGMDGTGHAG